MYVPDIIPEILGYYLCFNLITYGSIQQKYKKLKIVGLYLLFSSAPFAAAKIMFRF